MTGADRKEQDLSKFQYTFATAIISIYKIEGNTFIRLLTVSFIIPTYNAEQYLERCIASICKQEYPKELVEIIVADGGSTDRTLNILKKADIRVINNKLTIAEFGKHQAFITSKSDIVVFLDADNIIVEADWLHSLAEPLRENSAVMGVESNYLIADDFSSINQYANDLIIVDPLARLLASKPADVKKYEKYNVSRYPKCSAPVAGANGFLWRREALEPYVDDSGTLEETTILQLMASKADVYIANVPGQGIYHYYCHTFTEYLGKRKKIARKHLARRSVKPTWVDTRSRLLRIAAIIYLASIIGPTVEAVFNIFRTRRLSWLWHPLASFMTIMIYGYWSIANQLGKH